MDRVYISQITTGARSRSEPMRCVAAGAALAALLAVVAPAHAAEPGGSASAAKSSPVRLESVPGSVVPRVILTAKAAERLGIETGKVGEEAVVRKQIVGGMIVPPMDRAPQSKPASGGFGGFGKGAAAPTPRPAAADGSPQRLANVGFAGVSRAVAAPAPEPVAPPTGQAAIPASGEVWVFVAVSPAEWDRLASDKPARLLPLDARSGKTLIAQPSRMDPEEDRKRLMLKLYYVVPGKDHGLAVNDRVRVELQVAGDSDTKRKVVPYGTVFYDAKGDTWVYVNPDPLTFQRQRIVVERVEGDLAILSDGPAVGTRVVTVGAALLYGSEIFKK